jgi:hypothetical protein
VSVTFLIDLNVTISCKFDRSLLHRALLPPPSTVRSPSSLHRAEVLMRIATFICTAQCNVGSVQVLKSKRFVVLSVGSLQVAMSRGLGPELGRIAVLFSSLYVIQEYGVAVSMTVGPSMMPTFNAHGDIVIVNRSMQARSALTSRSAVSHRAPPLAAVPQLQSWRRYNSLQPQRSINYRLQTHHCHAPRKSPCAIWLGVRLPSASFAPHSDPS